MKEAESISIREMVDKVDELHDLLGLFHHQVYKAGMTYSSGTSGSIAQKRSEKYRKYANETAEKIVDLFLDEFERQQEKHSSVSLDESVSCTCEWAHPLNGELQIDWPAEIDPYCRVHGEGR